MSFSFSPDPVVDASDSHSVIAEVNNHIQKICPTISSSASLHMAMAFEQQIRIGATSRKDYVNRYSDGVRTIADSLKNMSFSSAGSTGKAAEKSTLSPTYPGLSESSEAKSYSAMQDFLLQKVSPRDGIAPFVGNLDPFLDKLVDLANAAASSATQIATATSVPGPAVITGTDSGEQTLPLLIGQEQQIMQLPDGAAPVTKETETAKPEDQGREVITEKKNAKISSKKRAAKTHVAKSTRRIRTRNTPSSPHNQEAKPPKTKSRARSVSKRVPSKRSTKGRKPGGKQSETGGQPAVENKKVLSQTLSSVDLGQNSPKGQNAKTSRTFTNKTRGLAELEITPTTNAPCVSALGDMKQNKKTPPQRSQQESRSLGCRSDQENNAACSSSAGEFLFPNAVDTNFPSLNDPRLGFVEVSDGERKPKKLCDIGRHSDSETRSHQKLLQTREYVHFCSNGMVEIEEGIVVSQHDLLSGAAAIGLILTADQIRSLRRDQALVILVKASQLELLEANGVTPPTTEGRMVDERRQPVRPPMMGPSNVALNVQAVPPSTGLSRQVPDQSEKQFHIPQQGINSYTIAHRTANSNLTFKGREQTASQKSPPFWKYARNIPEVHARLRKLQMEYKKYLSLLQGKVSGMTSRGSNSPLRYLTCCITLLTMDCRHVRGVSVDVIDNVDKFLRNFVNQHSDATPQNLRNRQVDLGEENLRVPTSTEHGPGCNKLDPQHDPQRMPCGSQYQFLSDSRSPQNSYITNVMQDTINGNGGKELIAAERDESLRQQGKNGFDSSGIDPIFQHDQVTSKKMVGQIQVEPNGRKKRACPTSDLEKNGKRMATSDEICVQNLGTENVFEPQERASLDIKPEKRDTHLFSTDLIDITNGTPPPTGVAVFCQKDKNGNMFNLLRFSDSPNLDEVLSRLRFMLNCAMKLTTCYISVSEGKGDDKNRCLEEVVVSLEARKIDRHLDDPKDSPEMSGLSMIELINAECAEARKRYGSLTVQMIEEFGRPIFRCILRYHDRPFPRLELRVAGPRKDEEEIRGFERPPMGWVGVLEQIRKLFCSSLEGGNGVEAMIRAWIRTKEEFNGWKELHARPEDGNHP